MIENHELAPGYSIARLVNGCWQLSEGHRPGGFDRSEVLAALRRLVESGFVTFDCADIYVGVEELLGELARSLANGSQIQVHTKFVPDRSRLATIDRRDVETGIDRSLARLGVERLDLVQFHWWDYDVPGYVETAGWLVEQQEAGKIRLLGTTNFDTRRLEELLEAGTPIVSNQVQYSLLDRRAESSMVELCRRERIQLLCYGTVAGGFLSARWVGQPEPRGPQSNRSLTKYKLIVDEFGGWKLFQELLRALSKVARRHRSSLTNVAMRWVLDRPQVAALLVGTRDASHVDNNLQVFDLSLEDDDRELIDGVLARARGPEGEPFDLERDARGPHAKLMKTDLNRESKR